MLSPKRTLHPDIAFERALCINRRAIHSYAWLAIGRLNGKTPFLLTYQGVGVTSWDCPVRLREGLRKKILSVFRQTCRAVSLRPAWVEFHDFAEEDALDSQAASARAGEITMAFHREVWRREYLNDREEDYVALKVPFQDKDAAKAAGARWEPMQKVWRVKLSADMAAFIRWLP